METLRQTRKKRNKNTKKKRMKTALLKRGSRVKGKGQG